MEIEWDYLGAVLLQWGLPLVPLLLLPFFLLKLPRERGWSKILAACAIFISLCILGLAAFFVDDMMPYPHSFLFCVILLSLAIAINAPLVLHFRSTVSGGILAIFCIAVVVMDYTNSDSKAFKRAYAQIHEGMTEQEASLAMKTEFSASSYAEPDFLRDDKNSSVEYLFPHAPNGKVLQGGYAAFIIIRLKNGRVVGKHYDND